MSFWIRYICRASGRRPVCASRSAATARASVVMVCRREENASISSWLIPAISRPCPSARGTHATPNSLVSAVSITAAAIAAAAPWNRYSDRESSLRHLPSRSVSTLFSTRLCTWSCGSPSREVCCRNDPITQFRACSHLPSSAPDSVPEPR